MDVDELNLLVVVDNETDALSSASVAVPRSNEASRLLVAAAEDGRDGAATFPAFARACHGLSVLLTGRRRGLSHTVLFDVGPDGALWLDNARRLGVDLAAIEWIVLSHWHSDHSAGLPMVLDAIADARRRAGLAPPVADLHPNRPHRRGIADPQGRVMYFEPEPTWEALEASGAEVRRDAAAHDIGDGVMRVSGEIPRITAYETGTPGHRSYDESGSWTDDALLLDERYLLAHVRGRGLTVLTACAHAGVVNTCLDAVATHPDVPVDLVLGGFHLAGAAVEDRIAATVADLHDRVHAAAVAPAHCTGWRGRTALAAAFGEEGYSPSSVGIRYALSAADLPGQGAASG